MLRVTVHAGLLNTACYANTLAWVDIAYDKLEPVADYQTALFQSYKGISATASIFKYPRWSASLWDLTARAIALGLRTDLDVLNEEVPAVTLTRKSCAFAKQICVLIEHVPAKGSHIRLTLASAEIEQAGRFRGRYVARFEEHAQKRVVTETFEYRPNYFRAAELVLHACLMRLTGKLEFPERPGLCVPESVKKDGRHHVPIHRLVEPARSGFTNWLHRKGQQPVEHAGAPLGLAPEALYARFLREAV